MTGNRTPPRCRSAVPTSSRSATSRHAVVEDGVAGDPQRRRARWPSQRSANPITSPTIGRLSGGPCRHGRGGDLDRGRPAPRARVVSHGSRPRAIAAEPARARARWSRRRRPRGSSARPASSRLSAWWSWVSSTASIGAELVRGERPGPASLRDDVPQPNAYRRPGGVERRIGEDPPAARPRAGRSARRCA